MTLQTSRLRSCFGPSNLELVFVNGPHISPGPAEPALASIVPAPFHEWWDSVNIAPEGAPKDYRYNGVEETLTAIQSTLEQEGPFDLVVGFSQGGILATMLTAAYERPEAFVDSPFAFPRATTATAAQDLPPREGSTTDDAQPRPPWKLVVLVSSLMPRDSRWLSLFDSSQPLRCPSVRLTSGLCTPPHRPPAALVSD